MTETKSPISEPLNHGLYIVATPIGNLGDITLRAVDILQRCDVVACEDTRVTGKLLKALNISKRMQRYDDHSGEGARAALIERARSEAVALVSDAGTPIISDPGFRLVSDAHEADIPITTLPGACAAIAGLTLSALPNDRFLFAGFLPVKGKARLAALEEFASTNATLIYYETGPRLVKSLHAIAELWPTREVAVARELTKLHEECRKGPAKELAQYYENNPPKGEIVLLIGPPEDEAFSGDPDALLLEALKTLKASQAAGEVAKATGLDRKTLYARAMELKSR
ncbi:MAG: 16S rRNA (cytidine(1402)-2'-O)-methyltransferase [Marinomonas sp.]